MGNPKLGSFEPGALGFSFFCVFFWLTVTVSLILVHVFYLSVFLEDSNVLCEVGCSHFVTKELGLW